MDRTVEPNTYAALDAFMASEIGDDAMQRMDEIDDFNRDMGCLVLEHGAPVQSAAATPPLARRTQHATTRAAVAGGALAMVVLVGAIAWFSGGDGAVAPPERSSPAVDVVAASQVIAETTVTHPTVLLTDIEVTPPGQPIDDVEPPVEKMVSPSSVPATPTAELLAKQDRLERELAAARKAATGSEARARQLQDELAKMRAIGETAMRRANESEAIIERALGNPANRTLTVVAALGDGVILRDAAGGEVIAPLGGRVRVNPDSGRAALEISAR